MKIPWKTMCAKADDSNVRECGEVGMLLVQSSVSVGLRRPLANQLVSPCPALCQSCPCR